MKAPGLSDNNELDDWRLSPIEHVKTDKNSLEADEGSAVGCGALWENQNPGGGSLKSLNDISARLSSRPNLGHLGSTHLRLISATAELLDSELFRSTKIVCMNLRIFVGSQK